MFLILYPDNTKPITGGSGEAQAGSASAGRRALGYTCTLLLKFRRAVKLPRLRLLSICSLPTSGPGARHTPGARLMCFHDAGKVGAGISHYILQGCLSSEDHRSSECGPRWGANGGVITGAQVTRLVCKKPPGSLRFFGFPFRCGSTKRHLRGSGL